MYYHIETPPSFPATVLVIDENEEDRLIVKEALEKRGYEVIQCASGEEAMDLAKNFPPAIVLLEIEIGNIEGFKICQKLMKLPEMSKVPVIFLSQDIDPEEVLQGFALGGADFIGKPLDPNLLVARVNTHVLLCQKIQESQKHAKQDGLTGLANKMKFNEFIELEFRRSMREQTPLSLLLIDVDYFKAYNDNYGHLTGDQVLVHLARLVERYTRRAGDLSARFGGEKLALILSNTKEEQAREIAETLREEIEKMAIPNQFTKVKKKRKTVTMGIPHKIAQEEPCITASLGVATLIPQQNSQVDHLIESALISLQRAKELGRNQVG